MLKIGVIGGYRGSGMINALRGDDRAKVVAIFDKSDEVLEAQKEINKGLDVTYFKDFDEMLKMDLDAVVLANYATEHAPFAIKALKAGKHVFSEVLPCQTLKEAVELVEAVEETGLIYAYGENYCYMPAPKEMRDLYRSGVLGEFEYGEGEYIHNCESIWHAITYGDKHHWRNNMYSTFYCTHSLGPIIHITGLRPVSVVGLETTRNERNLRVGGKFASLGIEMVTLSNGGIVKSIHGGLYKNSIWYSVYGSKGRAESAREDTNESIDKIYVNYDKFSGDYNNPGKPYGYKPELPEKAKNAGHGGSDYVCIDNFIKKLLGDETADTIDVYEALDMFLPGLMAFRSILNGNIEMPIPDFRKKEDREKYRNDVACTDPTIAGNQVLPTFSLGTPDIPDAVYEAMKNQYEYGLKNGDSYIDKVLQRKK